jgi:hypothetical protein
MACAAFVCAGLAGCQGESEKLSDGPPTKIAPPVAAKSTDSDAAAETGDPPEKKAEPDAPPVAAVRTLLREMEAGNLESLADFLPESYSRNLQALVQSLVKKTPDDVWQRLRGVIQKVVAVLKRQSEDASNGDDDVEGKKLAAALDQLSQEENWDRSRLPTWDLRSLLQGPASTLLSAWQRGSTNHATLLSETDVRLVEMDGENATLELRSDLDAEPQQVEFARVEGKWIPKSLSENWPAMLETALEKLSAVEETQLAEWAVRIKPVLLQIEGTLDQMIQAERPEEVQLGWWQIQSLLVQARQELLEPGAPPRVEVRIAGELTDETLTELLEQLQSATDHPELAEYVTFPTADGTAIQISPVKDLDDFVKRLSSVTVKSRNDEDRRIEVVFEPQRIP